MEDRLHVGVGGIEGLLIEAQIVLVVLADALLVEDAQHLVKAIIDFSVQTWYLHDDAVMVQTIHKRVGNAMSDKMVVVIVCLVPDVDDRGLYLAHGMPQQIDGYHGQGMTVGTGGHDVLRVLVVNAQILAEAQGLGGQPCLL